ncbi:MAG: hypothetical protein M0R06_00980 [Sphaerochaeta sp.]|jgi:hypothetical protein|nr:hypothetical protein [Sphaerochaeta sp.]
MRRPLWEVKDGQIQLYPHAYQKAINEAKQRYLGMIAGTGGGKALALDTPIPTPLGFVLMRDLRVGDTVFDEQGKPTRVEYVSPVYTGRKCYKLTFDDGTEVIADAEHLWVTQNRKQRKNAARRMSLQYRMTDDCSTLTTSEIADTLKGQGGAKNHSIDLAKPLELPACELPIDPYVLGVWLGDGTSSCASITTADPEVLGWIAETESVKETPYGKTGAAKTYRLGSGTAGGNQSLNNSLQSRLRRLGVLGNKHIPNRYLWASKEQRLALLQGLMDTDGTYGHRCEYCTTSKRLAYDVKVLVRSLGMKSFVTSRIPKCNGKACKRAYNVSFTTTLPVFRLARKAARMPAKVRLSVLRRFITDCEEVESVPVRCISVAAESQQYLCTEAMIPTHNTSFAVIWILEEMAKYEEGDFLWVEPNYKMLSRIAMPMLTDLFIKTLGLCVHRKVDQFFEWADGSKRLLLGSADKPLSLEGAHVKAVVLDEGGQMDALAWDVAQRRVGFHQGRILITSTPYSWNWLKYEVQDRFLAGDPDYFVVNFPSTANPLYSEKEFESMKGRMPEWKFNMMYRGVWSRPEGLIYDLSPDDVIEPFEIPKEWPVRVGLDWGVNNPTAAVWVAENPNTGIYYVYNNYAQSGLMPDESALVIAGLTGNANVYRYQGDGNGIAAPVWIDAFRRAGMPVTPIRQSVVSGIAQLDSLFRLHKIKIFRSCRPLLAEIGSYSWKTRKVVGQDRAILDEPMDVNDHSVSSLRYCMAGAVSLDQQVQWDALSTQSRWKSGNYEGSKWRGRAR